MTNIIISDIENISKEDLKELQDYISGITPNFEIVEEPKLPSLEIYFNDISDIEKEFKSFSKFRVLKGHTPQKILKDFIEKNTGKISHFAFIQKNENKKK